MSNRSSLGAVWVVGFLAACSPGSSQTAMADLDFRARLAPSGSEIPDNDRTSHPKCWIAPWKSDHVVKLILGTGDNTLLPSLPVFPVIAKGSLTCVNCQAFAGANQNGDDEEDPLHPVNPGQPAPSGWLTPAGSLPDLWQTPFDIDIVGNGSHLWSSTLGSNQGLLLKIILNDSTVHFYTPKDSAGNYPSTSIDSKWAVVAAGDNTGLLQCRGPIVKATPSFPHDFVTVKIISTPPKLGGNLLYGAINIGIVTRQADDPTTGNARYMPIYFDPNFKTNG